jgi:hypothetical protein
MDLADIAYFRHISGVQHGKGDLGGQSGSPVPFNFFGSEVSCLITGLPPSSFGVSLDFKAVAVGPQA